MVEECKIQTQCNDNSIKLVVLDLYGTLLNNPKKGGLSGDLVEMMEKIPLTIRDILDGKIYKNGKRLQISDELVKYIEEDIRETSLFPETLDVLNYLKSKGYKLAIVSNLSKDYTKPLYKLITDPKLFDYEVLSFDIGVLKPNPGIYEYLKSLSGIDFENMIMVGDSLEADVEGAYKVGITPIHVNRNSKTGIKKVENPVTGTKYVEVSTLTELMSIL